MGHYIFYFMTFVFYLTAVHGLDSQCPEEEKISPCTCVKDCTDCEAVITCKEIKTGEDLLHVFQNTGDSQFPIAVFKNIHLTYFPASALESKRFVSLSIVNSSLTSLFDTSPSEASILQELVLHYVRVQRSIQWQQFSTLHSLKSIIFSSTAVRKIDDSFGMFIPKQVKVIHFIDTKTSRITRNAFAPLRNLEYLTIRSNLIKSFDRSMLPKPLRIKILDLSANRLETFPDDFFADMPSLTGVNLSNNTISIFKESVFKRLPLHLQYISVRNNPIKCDCSISWLTSLTRVPFIDGKCTAPKEMVDRTIRQLKRKDFKPC